MKTSETNLTNPAGAGLVERVWDDSRLRAVYICLYSAIAFHCMKASQNQLQISRRKLMHYGRIKSSATYQGCVRDLARFGHIDFHFSFHPLHLSRIVLSGQDKESLNN